MVRGEGGYGDKFAGWSSGGRARCPGRTGLLAFGGVGVGAGAVVASRCFPTKVRAIVMMSFRRIVVAVLFGLLVRPLAAQVNEILHRDETCRTGEEDMAQTRSSVEWGD